MHRYFDRHYNTNHIRIIDFAKMTRRQLFNKTATSAVMAMAETCTNTKHTPNCFLGKFSSRRNVFESADALRGFTNPSKESVFSKLSYSSVWADVGLNFGQLLGREAKNSIYKEECERIDISDSKMEGYGRLGHVRR